MKANEITFQIFAKILEKNSALRVAKKKSGMIKADEKPFVFFRILSKKIGTTWELKFEWQEQKK